MPRIEHGAVTIHYEERGSWFPVLMIAPGGMNSSIPIWDHQNFNPLHRYPDDFRLIAIDQRNAHSGDSSGPFDLEDPWGSFVDDHLALLDHLEVDRFHDIGCCIGCSHALLIAQRGPERLVSAVLIQPIGIVGDNHPAFESAWRDWAALLKVRRGDDLDMELVERFATRMWDGDFILSVSRDSVRTVEAPLLVLPGTDHFHPPETSHEIVALARHAEILEPWDGSPEITERTVAAVRNFLKRHTPKE